MRYKKESGSKQIIVKEIILNGLKSTEKDEPSYHKHAFFEYQNIRKGDEITLCYDERKKYWNQFSLLFDNDYQNKNYKKNIIYKASIIIELKDFYILKFTEDKYGKIYKNNLIEKDSPYIIGEILSVSLDKRNQFSTYEANFNLFKKEISNESGFYSLKIKKIEKIENNEKKIVAFNFTTSLGFKIFCPQNKNLLFDLNYGFLLSKIYEEDSIELRFYYNAKRCFFSFNVSFNLTNIDDDDKLANLKYSDENSIYYIETEYGYSELNTWNLSYFEKKLLKLLKNNLINYCVEKKLNSFGRTEIIVKLKRLDYSHISDLKGKEYNDLKIVDFIDNKLDKRVYLVAFGGGLYGFMEKSDYSYHNIVAKIGEVVPKLKVKNILNDTFIFLTRKPYLTDPKIDFFKSKESGERIRGKVLKIYDTFLIISLDGNFNLFVFKKDLKPLEFFDIKEFYQEGSIYDFYIEGGYPKISLMGYDVASFYNEELSAYKNNTLCQGLVYKKMVTKYIVRLSESIEASLPLDEVSHLDINDFKPEKNTKYQFRIISFENTQKSYKIVLSRKKLSHPVYAFRQKYAISSIISGNYFYKTNNGFYFHLKHNANEIAGLIGYLPNNEIANYPDIEKFEQEIINNSNIKFKITAYPNENILKYGNLFEKSLTLSIKSLSNFNIKDYYYTLNENELFFKKNDIMIRKTSFLNDPNRVYFMKIYKGNEIVYSLKEEEFIPGLFIQEDINFNKFYNIYTKNLTNFYKQNSLSFDEKRFIQGVFGVDSKTIDTFVLKNIRKNCLNKINNTIEISSLDYYLSFLKENFENFDAKIAGYDENGYFAWFLNNEKLKIKIHILNNEVNIGESYKLNIVDYFENEKILVGEFVSLNESCIGNYYYAEVLGKIGKDEYSVKFLSEMYGSLKSYNSNLISKERIFVPLKDVVKGKYFFEYKYNKNDLFENSQRVAINNLHSMLKDSRSVKNMNKEEILNIYLVLKEKYALINNREILNKINKIIYLLENGIKRDEFIIENRIFGQGQFGKVYKGQNLLNFEKVINKKFISNREDDIEAKRFQIEAETLESLDEEGFVKLHRYYEAESEYISGFAKGLTLRKYISDNRERNYKWKIENYISILIKIAKILDTLNSKGIVHCDIKPENIIYDEKNDKIYIIDLGSVQNSKIKGGFGTIYYSSPKQCDIFSNKDKHNTEEHNFTVKDDIYSFGIMMYEIFTNKLPYGQELEEATIVYAHQFGQLDKNCEYSFKNPSVVNEEIEESIEEIILKSIALEEDKRYEDFFEVIDALEEL